MGVHTLSMTVQYARKRSVVAHDLQFSLLMLLKGTIIHVHKRYSAFQQLYVAIRRTLPVRKCFLVTPI